MTSEAEIGEIFINTREAIPTRKTLEEMGHPQPRTLIQTNNLAAHSVVTNNVQPTRTKAMQFHWLRCCNTQGQFRYYWRLGTMNLVDYWTKHHPSSHHTNMRPEFLMPWNDLMDLYHKKQQGAQAVELSQAIYDSSPATRVC